MDWPTAFLGSVIAISAATVIVTAINVLFTSKGA